MRYLKRLIMAVLIYIAIYLPFIAILQALTGYDYTAAYAIGGGATVAELALSSLIKINEEREAAKNLRAPKKDAESVIT